MARSSKPAIQPSPRVLANKQNGQRGGLATAAKHGKEFLTERAEKGGQAVRDRYGVDYYRHIGKLRTPRGWPKGKARKVIVTPAMMQAAGLMPNDAASNA